MMNNRRKYSFIFIFILFFFAFFSAAGEAVETIMPVDQIKIGMQGKGRTVFLGRKIEEFDVKIIGIMHNFTPKRDLILARMSHPILAKAGVIEGMSGSPVYIDGRLIGAVAYSLGSFTTEAVAGITPIAEMMAIPGHPASPSTFSSGIPIKKELSLDELYELNKDIFPARSFARSGGQLIKPLDVPLLCSGFSSHAFDKAKSFFSRLGFAPISSGGSGQSIKLPSEVATPLKEGDPVGVQLVSGDLDMTAVGTVTRVDGRKVYAFGHPMYNLGKVDYTMTKVDVFGVVPSLSSSFKLAASGEKVGRITQDRSVGIYGEMGKRARLIPMNISMLGGRGDLKDYHIFITDNKILTPALTNVAVANLLSAEERSFGDLTLRFTGDIYLQNGRSIHMEDLYSGNYDAAVTGLSNMMASVVFFLTNNEFKNLDIHRIDLKIQASEEIRFSYLERVWLDKYDARPGETILIKIFYRNFRGQTITQKIPFLTPSLPAGSELYLAVADAASMRNIELAQYRSQTFVPRSLNQLLRLLSNLRKNNRIYFKVFASKPGLFLKGEEMPNLPPTMKSMYLSPRAASSSPVEIFNSTLSQYQIPIDYVFQGAVVVPIKIK